MFNNLKEFTSLLKYWRKHPIASKDFLGTIRRFFRWQVGVRLLRAPVVLPWIGSTKLVVEKGMTGLTMNYYCGLHEFYDMAFLLHFLRSEDVFVDVGANVGSYTVLASGVVGAKTICIEPIPTTFQKLLLNVDVNNMQGKVDAYCYGIGAINGGTLSFVADRDTMNQVAPSGYKGKTVDVPIRSLDSLLSDINAIFWKVDVEGFEEQVLLGGHQALKSPSLLAIEMEGDNPLIRQTLKSESFSPYNYDPINRVLRSNENEKNSHNWLWIRDVNQVLERCKSAAKFSVGNAVF